MKRLNKSMRPSVRPFFRPSISRSVTVLLRTTNRVLSALHRHISWPVSDEIFQLCVFSPNLDAIANGQKYKIKRIWSDNRYFFNEQERPVENFFHVIIRFGWNLVGGLILRNYCMKLLRGTAIFLIDRTDRPKPINSKILHFSKLFGGNVS